MTNTSDQSNSACSLSDERQVLLVQYILGGWTSCIIVLFGVFSNGLSILVLGNSRMRHLSTNIYLLSLSIVNLAWLILYFGVNSFRFTLIVPKFLANRDGNDHHEYDDFVQRFSPYVVPLMNTLQLCSIYYTVAVSFDRFLYLSYGIQAEAICTVRNSLRVITCITICSILFILPHWFKYRVELNENNRPQLKLTSIGENELFRKIIHIWLYIPAVYALPFLLLIFINFFTLRLLRKFYLHRRQNLNLTSALSTQNNEQRERDITLMLIAVVLLFFICRFPMLINHIFETKFSLTSYDDRESKNSNSTRNISYDNCRSRRLFNTTVNFLQTINASANLFFYYLFGENFRETSFQLAKQVRKRVVRRRNTLVENITYYIQRQNTNANITLQNRTIDQQQQQQQQQSLILLNMEQGGSTRNI
ncbi:unnamed protein product [Rotaria magnacalcarata]|uniref:G-protein coupled receptors family 1 profile domain-containing protein n=1 Tax=Rotaria magnacalcarata TaxID=392030 RepID=A0A816KL16_9BILA|nr:unnamed protein product [Rotaria magnacalcarata]CAF1319501.1 unnamed protein product [Rotaria magnacalcarata]CAF1922099.1 unnamed protein product [Rotaria magnacalcarata]CAF3789030.1 unnamed protein product [Rotaria magnacalcarata]CAF3854367.1 unnamed protein product [Rotaria magnacalcarata]